MYKEQIEKLSKVLLEKETLDLQEIIEVYIFFKDSWRKTISNEY